LNITEHAAFRDFFDPLPSERKTEVCKDMIYQQLNKMDTIEAADLRAYIERIVEGMSKDDLSALENAVPSFAAKIKKKIQTLEDVYN
jgi:type III restriction enzyme